MKRKFVSAIMALITAGILLTGCGLSKISVPEYNVISQEQFWNGLVANGYSQTYDMTESYKETLDMQHYDDTAYYYDGKTEFIFSDFSGNSAASFFYQNVTEQYTKITSDQKTVSIGSTERWTGTDETDNIAIFVYRVDDVVITAIGTYDNKDTIKSVVEDILENPYNTMDQTSKISGGTVIQQEETIIGENMRSKTIDVGDLSVTINATPSWNMDTSYDFIVPVQTENGLSVVYSDSYIDTGDAASVISTFEMYECDETAQVDINGRQSYVGYRTTSYNTYTIYVLQNIGGSSYLEIEINDVSTDADIMQTVSDFALNL